MWTHTFCMKFPLLIFCPYINASWRYQSINKICLCMHLFQDLGDIWKSHKHQAINVGICPQPFQNPDNMWPSSKEKSLVNCICPWSPNDQGDVWQIDMNWSIFIRWINFYQMIALAIWYVCILKDVSHIMNSKMYKK